MAQALRASADNAKHADDHQDAMETKAEKESPAAPIHLRRPMASR